MRRAILALVLLGAVFPQAVDAQSCDGPQPSVATLPSLSVMIAKAKLINGKKGEYESTASYQARLAAAGHPQFDHDITVVWQQSNLTKFNPDTGHVIVDRYTVDTTCDIFKYSLPAEMTAVQIGSDPKYDWQKKDTPYCITKPAGSAKAGSYIGSNAYGATRHVDSFRNHEDGIYLGVGLIGQDYFPAAATGNVDDNPWLEAPATVEQAKSLKANAVLLITVSPKPPYYATGHAMAEATIDSPTEIVFNKEFLVGDIKCVALADRVTGKVFASRPFVMGER